VDRVFRALAHPARRRILNLLKEGPLSAGEIAEAFDFSKPTLSGHLDKLRSAGLVHARKQANRVIYSLNTSIIEGVLAAVYDVFGQSPAAAHPDDGGDDVAAK